MRSRIQLANDSDRPTRFFLSQAKERNSSQSIQELFDGSGTPGGSTEHLLRSVREFYTDLYRPTDTCQNEQDHLINSLTLSADDDQHSFLESPISLAEMTAALRGMKPNKAPGIDGLPVEFYRRFWDIISDDLHAVFSEVLALGRLGGSQRTGIVV